ncbi:hypothetical protein [Phenylobacterium sp.]|uniref:hypothetical protein n=1 Tax=Phenylobacterium sp. TaxID=1871053 RepID=UPI0025D43109|nr:hypothetical protein [Phenylobacterium sp.]
MSRTSTALAATRGIVRQDYTLEPTVSVDLVQPIGRQEVFLNAVTGYDFHRENTQLNRGRASLEGGYVTSLGICQGSAIETYSASQSDLAQIDSTQGLKNLRETYGTAVGVQCGLAQGIQGGVHAQRQETFNSAQVQRTADNTVRSLGAELGYGNATLGKVSLIYNYSENQLPNQIIPGQPVGNGFFSTTYGVNLQHSFGSRLQVGGNIGRTLVKRGFAPPGVKPKFSSTTYSGQASYRFGNNLEIDVGAARAVLPTSRAGKLYDITTSGQINAHYRLGTRIGVNAGYRIADVKSNVDTTTTFRVITNSRSYTTSGSVTYRQSRHVSLGVDVVYDDRNTNLPEFNYTATRVGLMATFEF